MTLRAGDIYRTLVGNIYEVERVDGDQVFWVGRRGVSSLATLTSPPAEGRLLRRTEIPADEVRKGDLVLDSDGKLRRVTVLWADSAGELYIGAAAPITRAFVPGDPVVIYEEIR